MQPIVLFCVVLAVLGSLAEGERLGNHLSFGNAALGKLDDGSSLSALPILSAALLFSNPRWSKERQNL